MLRPLAGTALALVLLSAGATALAQEPGTDCVPPTIASVDVVHIELFPEREGLLGWAYRTGNRLHIDTKPSVVRNELLFEEGDPLDPEQLAQSERNLRVRRFISEARVEVLFPDGRRVHAEELEARTCAAPGAEEVTVLVTTRDSWSLSLEGKLSKTGNRWLWEVGVDESNLLGLGKSIGFGYSRDIDRDSFRVGFHDPQIAGTPHEMRAEYRDQSDGSSFRFSGGRFVRSLEDIWSYDGRLERFDQNQPLYQDGESVAGLRHSRRHYAVQGGRRLHRSPDSTLRLFAGYRQEFDDVEVEVRDYGVFQVGASWVHHRFRQLRWVDHERPIDVNLGADSGLWFGYALRNEGDRPGTTFFVAAHHNQGLPLGPSRMILGNVSWASRVRRGVPENGTLRARVLFADYAGHRQTFILSGQLIWGVNLDPEVQVLLGVNTGLRGYRVNQFAGDRSLLITAEHRWFFADDVLGLVSLGATGFFDSGHAWYEGEPLSIQDMHSNVGLGLLIGRKQVSTVNAGMRIDLAYALDPIPGLGRWVLSFGTTHGF